jgi:hypothetical protein
VVVYSAALYLYPAGCKQNKEFTLKTQLLIDGIDRIYSMVP